MFRSQIIPMTAFVLLTASAASAANPAAAARGEVVEGASHPVTAAEAAEAREAAEQTPRLYGPIRSEDPLVRAQIKRLYIEQNTVQENGMTGLRELSERLSRETDPDFRMEIRMQATQIKMDLERSNIEIGLEIAQLNDDEARAADFARALDQLNNPVSNRTDVDPTILEQRIREQVSR